MYRDDGTHLRGERHPHRCEQPGSRVVTGMCGVCPAGCGAVVHLTEGRIVRLSPLADHPRRLLCPRGTHAPAIVYSPDRLLTPLARARASSGAALAPTSWSDAYRRVVAGLQQIRRRHGAHAIATYTGRGNFELGLNDAFAPAGTEVSSANAVLFPFGSPNASGVGSLCYVAFAMIGTRSVFGEYLCNTDAEIEHASLVVVWGANPATATPRDMLERIVRARRRGARVIVIDHRRSATARATDAEWIGVRPGTDGALALGLIRQVIEERRYDERFVDRWTHGFAELREYVRPFVPERVAAITGVPAARIRSLARQLADAPSCSLVMYTGLEYSDSGVQAIRAAWCLQGLLGRIDAPGGNRIRERRPHRTGRTVTDVPTGAPPPIGAAEYPLYHQVRNEAHAALLPKAILDGDPYPIRGLIISGASLITSWPNPALWRRALAALDLLVVVDRFLTADAAHADVVLPAATLFETESYMAYESGWLQLRRRVIPPLGEARSDYLVFAELARRLGYGDRWPQSERAMIDAALAPTGLRYEDLAAEPAGVQLPVPASRYRKYERGELRADGRPGFETPTGKLELASTWLGRHGYEPLPVYTEPAEGPMAAPELAKRFPLVLDTGARTPFSFRSQDRNIPELVRREPVPLVWIHPDDAAPRDIVDGDEVVVRSPRGAIRMTARVTADVVAGAVEAQMGGGGPLGPAAWRRSNVNELTDLEHRDPISGFPVYKALLCDVDKLH